MLLGEATHSAVAHAVVAEQAPPIAAKGKSEALVAYRLVGLRPDVPAFARPISTPFVGRRREGRRPPSRIRRRGHRSAPASSRRSSARRESSRGSRVKLVAGLVTGARVLVGRCVAYGQGISYLPLADVVREVAGEDRRPSSRGSWRLRIGETWPRG